MARLPRLLSLYGGLFIVSIWTLLRSFTNGVNFDVVGQIGLAQQWAHGQFDGAQLGATNYLIKIPLYFLVNQLEAIPALYRLTLLALVCNLLTFYLLFRLFEKIMDIYEVNDRRWFFVSFLWLATIAGNLFWLDYANSRNLETVGGIYFLYWIIKYLKQQQLSALIWAAITGTVVFFADPLQFYVCGLASILFVWGRLIALRRKQNFAQAIMVTLVSLLAYVGSIALTHGAQQLLHVSVLHAPITRTIFTTDQILPTLKKVILSTLTVFDANIFKESRTPVFIREIFNAVVLIFVSCVLTYKLVKKGKPTAYGLGLTAILLNFVIYIASGQVAEWQTARYLVMVPLLTVMMLAVFGDKLTNYKTRRFVMPVGVALFLVSGTLLLGALVLSVPVRYEKDAHISNVVSFMNNNHFKYALASREVGITATYFSQGKSYILPMGCQADHTIQPTSLFYDQAAFKGLYDYSNEVPIIVDSKGIIFGKNICSQDDIVAQFGAPKRLTEVNGIGTALIYNAAQLRITGIDKIVGHTRRLNTTDVDQLISNHTMSTGTISFLTKLQGCTSGVTDVIVAHPDDDLLFMNPSVATIVAKQCMRTIFVTAADDGRANSYWLNRQNGIEAAYAHMIGVDNIWTDATATINGRQILTRQLTNHPQVSLVFMRLPDGGVYGKGFAATGLTSIERISHSNSTVVAVDGSASYSYADLTNTLAAIIKTDKPRTIYTLLSSGPLSSNDHSDHRAVGALTLLARTVAKSDASVRQYVGYPGSSLVANLSDNDARDKQKIFEVYASHDGVICNEISACDIAGTYGAYFSRSYYIPEFKLTDNSDSNKRTKPKAAAKKKLDTLNLFQRNLEY